MDVAVKQQYNVSELATSLWQPSFLDELKSYVDYVVLQDDFVAAYPAQKNLALALERAAGLQTQNRKAWQLYQQCLWRLRAVALPALSDEFVIATLTEGLPVVIAEPDIDLNDKLEGKIVRILIHEERDAFKARLREALSASSVPLFPDGSHPVVSISEWLKNYSQAIGYATVEPFKRQQYLNDNPAPRGLRPPQREQLRRFLVLFDTLKLSSLTPEGLEDVMTFERDGKRLVLNHGQVYEVSQVADPILVALLPRPSSSQDAGVDSELGISATAPETLTETRLPAPAAPPPVASATLQRAPAVPATLPTLIAPVFGVLPEPQVFKKVAPAFVFDIEDEREADKFRLPEPPPGTNLEQRLRDLADDVIAQYKFSFKDEVNKRRFVHLFVSFLKGVRDAVEVREVLTKPVDTGGLGLAGDKAEQVLVIVTKVKQQLPAAAPAPVVAAKPIQPLDKLIQSDIAPFLLKTSGVVKPPVPAPVASVPLPPRVTPPPTPTVSVSTEALRPFSFGTSTVTVAAPGKPITPVPPVPPVAAPGIPGAFTPEKVQQWRQEMLQEIARVAPPITLVHTTQSTALPAGAANSAPTQVRPRLADVKATPRTMGPVGELKSLGVTDFRRLGNVVQALDKVHSKIDLLGEASVAKRLEAVRAWQASPVYQAYLRLGRESIERGSKIADTATALSAEERDSLTEAEFNAIADFNAKLRF